VGFYLRGFGMCSYMVVYEVALLYTIDLI